MVSDLREMVANMSPAERAALHERVQQVIDEGEETGTINLNQKRENVASRQIMTLLQCPRCKGTEFGVQMDGNNVAAFLCIGTVAEGKPCGVRIAGHDDGNGPE